MCFPQKTEESTPFTEMDASCVSLRREQQTLIIHLSETGSFFCSMHPYRCLFKNRGRWLEFNVRVIAWSIALIFVFEWSGCMAKLPITIISEERKNGM